jgi:hypothetical protein
MGSALARQRVQLQNQQQALQARLQATSSPKVISHVQAKITALQAQQQMLEPDHQDYTLSLHALSQAIHPFHLNTGEPQLALELPARLSQLVHLRTAESHLCPNSESSCAPALAAADFRPGGDTPCLVAVGAACPPAQTQDPDTQHWVLTALLPWVYWHQQTQRPAPTQTGLSAAQQAQARFLADGFTRPCPTLSNSSGSIGQPGLRQVPAHILRCRGAMAVIRSPSGQSGLY